MSQKPELNFITTGRAFVSVISVHSSFVLAKRNWETDHLHFQSEGKAKSLTKPWVSLPWMACLCHGQSQTESLCTQFSSAVSSKTFGGGRFLQSQIPNCLRGKLVGSNPPQRTAELRAWVWSLGLVNSLYAGPIYIAQPSPTPYLCLGETLL